MARVFVYEGREFPDPDINRTVEDIKTMMSDFFPELANAEVKQVERGDDTIFEFQKRVGTKGEKKPLPPSKWVNAPEGTECPYCGSKDVSVEPQGGRWYGCRECRKLWQKAG